MSAAQYTDVGDDWVFPSRKDFRLSCCGCGLIHKIQFRLVNNPSGGKSIELKFRRVSGRRVKVL